MNLRRDRARPVCAICKMRSHKCLCSKPTSRKTTVPDLVTDKAQTTLPIVEQHVGSRVHYWRRWMETKGVRLGLWVQPEQHLSSQDHCQAPLSASSQPLEDDGDREGGRRGGDLPKKSKGAACGARSEGKDDTVS